MSPKLTVLTPGREGHVGGLAADNRLFIEAVLYRYRVGIPWRDLPARLGDWKIVHQRLRRWYKSGVFESIYKLLASDHDSQYMMIDATVVRVHQHSAGARKNGDDQAIGRSRGGLTKIHAIVDALGNPVALSQTRGQASDLGQAEPLSETVDPKAFLADKAYDADALVDMLENRNITPMIPPQANRLVKRPTDFRLYRERNLVEKFFNILKQFRAIATRYDKLASTFLAAVQFASAMILLKMMTRSSRIYAERLRLAK